MILQELQNAIAKAAGVETSLVHFEHPVDLSHGDYACNIALVLAKKRGEDPRALAEQITQSFEKRTPEGIEKIEVVNPGFINVHFTRAFFAKSISDMTKQGEGWGNNKTLLRKKIMVEYTDPNPFKEMHIGHLMSNAIGESIARLLEACGSEIKRANYQGDVGPHVAKAIWGKIKYPDVLWGRAYQIANDVYETDPIIKKEIGKLNKKIYERDPEILSLYEKGRKESLDNFEKIYEKLGMKPRKQSGNERFFDYYFFESGTWPIGKKIVEEHPDVFPESDGARVFKGEEYGLHTRVFLTSQGLPTYEAKDLGLAKLKSDTWDFDVSITITGNEQKEYFQVVLSAMKKVLPVIAPKIQHITHGMMRFAEGKMSSRKGNVITALSLLQDILDVAEERTKESRADDKEALAAHIALGAIKYQILKQAPGKDIIFDRERALSLEGDSGPYLQYAYARTVSVLEKAEAEGVPDAITEAPHEILELERLLYRFPEVVERARNEYAPHHITMFLIEIASAFNSWYAKERIVDDTPYAPYKVALTKAFSITMRNGLWLLGIHAPERM